MAVGAILHPGPKFERGRRCRNAQQWQRQWLRSNAVGGLSGGEVAPPFAPTLPAPVQCARKIDIGTNGIYGTTRDPAAVGTVGAIPTLHPTGTELQ